DIDFVITRTRLRVITDDGSVDIEGHALLHAKTHQRELLFGARGKGVEVEHGNTGAIIRQNQSGATLLSVLWHDFGDHGLQGVSILDVVMNGGDGEHRAVEGLESGLLRRGGLDECDPILRQFESVCRWWILQKVCEWNHLCKKAQARRPILPFDKG